MKKASTVILSVAMVAGLAIGHNLLNSSNNETALVIEQNISRAPANRTSARATRKRASLDLARKIGEQRKKFGTQLKRMAAGAVSSNLQGAWKQYTADVRQFAKTANIRTLISGIAILNGGSSVFLPLKEIKKSLRESAVDNGATTRAEIEAQVKASQKGLLAYARKAWEAAAYGIQGANAIRHSALNTLLGNTETVQIGNQAFTVNSLPHAVQAALYAVKKGNRIDSRADLGRLRTAIEEAQAVNENLSSLDLSQLGEARFSKVNSLAEAVREALLRRKDKELRCVRA